jgi:outer membrane protein assembly factor BamB
MDYESRKIKWYWLMLFTAYSVAVVYLVFQGNPFLYSRQDLRSSLDVAEVVHRQPIPLHPPETKITSATHQARYNLERTGDDPMATPRSKNYTEYERAKVVVDEKSAFDFQNVSSDSTGFYVTGKSPWALALGLDGKPRWKFGFKNLRGDRALPPVLLDETSAYLVHPQGEVVCLEKATGRLRWSLALKEELAAPPILWRKHLLIPVKNGSGVQFTMVNRSNAAIEEDNPRFDLKPGLLLSLATGPETLIAVYENKVVAIDPEEWQVLWTHTVSDPIKGPALTIGNQIYLATLGAKVVKLDGAKKGKPDWEADTVKAAAGSPVYLPIMGKLAVLDSSGFISFFDAKTGKVHWRIPTENHTGFSELWAARLKGAHIEEFGMDWLHKGWTVWSPCYDRHFCIYSPKQGGIIARVALSGHPVALPQPVDKRWAFLTQSKPGGEYTVSQVVEDAEIKKLKAGDPRPLGEGHDKKNP